MRNLARRCRIPYGDSLRQALTDLASCELTLHRSAYIVQAEPVSSREALHSSVLFQRMHFPKPVVRRKFSSSSPVPQAAYRFLRLFLSGLSAAYALPSLGKHIALQKLCNARWIQGSAEFPVIPWRASGGFFLPILRLGSVVSPFSMNDCPRTSSRDRICSHSTS